MFPPKDKPCSQWITFNTDQEPVLNNAPTANEGCDNFLKRLQRTQLHLQDSCSPVPAGQQFCFEPVTDKRYNRWKRRRRKKKSTESRRPTFTIDSDFSDDENDREMERIIGHMYQEINGPTPETPNGTIDTPRMRNRRRRRGFLSKSDTQVNSNPPDSTAELHYDASSEWVPSDVDQSDEELHFTRNTCRTNSQRSGRQTHSAGYRTADYSVYLPEDFTSFRQSHEFRRQTTASSLSLKTLSSDSLQDTPDTEPIPLEEGVRCVSVHCEMNPSPEGSATIHSQEGTKPLDSQCSETPQQIADQRSEDQHLNDNHCSERLNEPEVNNLQRGCCSNEQENQCQEQRSGSSCTDDMYLEQYREEIMQRVRNSPSDVILNKDCLPDIPKPTPPETGNREQRYKITKTNQVFNLPSSGTPESALPVSETPNTASRTNGDRSLKVQGRPNSFSDVIKVKRKTIQHRIPLRLSTSSLRDHVGLPRRTEQLGKSRVTEDTQTSISRSSASNWSELGCNPKRFKPVGVVSVAASPELKLTSSSFRASHRPIRNNTPKSPFLTEPKESLTLKKKTLRLPKIIKTRKGQTMPSFQGRNSVVTLPNEFKPEVNKADKEQPERPSTIPQTKSLEKKVTVNTNLAPRAEFMFRDYYLRSLYNSKARNGTEKKFKSTLPVKQTITVDRLDIGTRKPAKTSRSDSESNVTNLSFTRAFTFSLFGLPDYYKVYNKRIARKAR